MAVLSRRHRWIACCGIGWLTVMFGCASAQAQDAADRYGDPLPTGATARLGSIRFRHGQGVAVIAVSRDGKFIASAGRSALRVWDASTGKEIRTLAHSQDIRAIDFSPD